MGIGILENTRLGHFLRRAAMLDEKTLFIEVMNKQIVQKFIVKLNTDQMRLHFMNSDGKLLADIGGSYSPTTMSKGKKQSPNSVDLYDLGDFHDSFKIVGVSGDQFGIDSDPVKDDGTNLLVEWGAEIEGLTFENLRVAAEFMHAFYKDKIIKYLLGK